MNYGRRARGRSKAKDIYLKRGMLLTPSPPHSFLLSSPSILRLASFQDDKYDTRGFKLNFEEVKMLWY